MAVALPPTEPFEPTRLQALLDGRYAELRHRLLEVIGRDEFAPRLGIATAEYREQVLAWAQQLAAEGLTVPGFPRAFGGEDDPGANVAGFETLAFGDLSLLVKFGVQFGLFGGAVHQLGTERHHETLLGPIARLELPGCFAMTEAGHGSDVQHLLTTATYDRADDTFVIDTPTDAAHKDYIGNAACHGRMAVVFAQLIVGDACHGVHAFLVDIRDESGRTAPGVRIEDCGEKMGLNGVDNGRLWFDGVRAPRTALLNRYGDVDENGVYTSPIEKAGARFFTTVGALVQGRVCIAGASVSAAKTALTIAIRYGLRRRQFGPSEEEEVPVLEYRTHQRRLMPLLAKTYALHFAQERLRDAFDDAIGDRAATPDRDQRELETLAAGLKATASWHATTTIQTCRECCGGAGYMSVNRFAALKADTDVFTTFEGDNTVLMMLVAKGLLTDFRDHFGELNPRETVTFVAEQAVESVVERLFARQIVQTVGDVIGELLPTGEEEPSPADRSYQLELFRWREGHMTAAVARRFRRGLGDGHDAFEVFRAVQDHAAAAAQAHLDTVLLEALDAAVRRCEDPGLAAALDRLCDLYALAELEASRGYLQEHGRLSGARCKAITREVNRLCNEVRAQAGELVDAFGIPDAVLRAPIGLADPTA